MKSLKQSTTINAPIEKVWDALVNSKAIEKWGAGPNVVMDDKVGTQFKLWDGDTHGKNIEVKQKARLVQEWVSGDWAKPSRVEFNLHSDDDKTTQLDLVHTNIPDDEYESIAQGWKDYYLGPMKKYLEN